MEEIHKGGALRNVAMSFCNAACNTTTITHILETKQSRSEMHALRMLFPISGANSPFGALSASIVKQSSTIKELIYMDFSSKCKGANVFCLFVSKIAPLATISSMI